MKRHGPCETIGTTRHRINWRHIPLGVLLAVLCIPAFAGAADLSGTSKTYLQSRESAGSANLMPLYEYLDLAVQNAGNKDISVHFGGWLGYDLWDDSFGNNKQKGSDLQYGYVSYRAKDRNAVANLGRVMVFEGVAAERLDGIFARTDIKGGFGASAYGGAPVETGTDLPGNSTIYGVRLSHQMPGLYTVGLSYLKEEKNSSTFREVEGVDLWVRPLGKVELMGQSSYNAEFTGWQEHAYYLVLGPFDKLRFNTEYSWINYDAYFAGATTNVFAFLPGGPIDPKEKVNILGEEVFYTIDKNWAVSADYKKFNYDIGGNASYYGVKAAYSAPKSYTAGAALHKMDGASDSLAYNEFRVYASKTFQKSDVAVDLLFVNYEEAINGVSKALSATVAAGHALNDRWKIGADLQYSKNPDYDENVSVFLKAIYRFDAALGKRQGV